MANTIIQVILPELKSLTALPSYTYLGVAKTEYKIGQLVNVNFGNKELIAIIKSITTIADQKEQENYQLKTVGPTTSTEIIFSQKTLNLIEKISSYYFCTNHQAAALFLPPYITKNLSKPEKYKTSSFLKKLSKQTNQEFKLTEEQETVISNIFKTFNSNKIHTLIGPTGSGKTEIYKQLSTKISTQGQALILVPEISITPQLAQYFYNEFGEKISIWHSGLTQAERKTVWWQVYNQETQIIIGSRSALFLPYQNLELICLDEEQEDSYKQDKTPRYHARTIAQFLTEQNSCPLILGSATPSLETYASTLTNRTAIHRLSKRVNSSEPKITIVDLKEETKKGNFSIFSELLIEKLTKILENKKQAILFLNRRGFAKSRQCRTCGHTEQCKNCDTSLTVHKPKTGRGFLQCHICGRSEQFKDICQSCGSHELYELGLGTQQVVSEISKIFPEAKVLRADSDTTVGKHDFQKIYEAFKNQEADILVGTQMIAKGLHLPAVELVGVMLADNGLHMPDFRAQEKAFQQLIQVAGRAGRASEDGEVIIQTYNPQNKVIQSLSSHNLDEFYQAELEVRQKHNFPPYQKITKLTYTDRDNKKCVYIAQNIEDKLRNLNQTFLGAPALIFKQYKLYHYNILLFSTNPEAIIPLLNLSPAWRIDRDPANCT